MTTLALPILVTNAVIILLALLGLVIWHKRSVCQENRLHNIERRLEGIEDEFKNMIISEQKAREAQEKAQAAMPPQMPETTEKNTPTAEELLKEVIPESPDLQTAGDKTISREEGMAAYRDFGQQTVQADNIENHHKGKEPASKYNIGKSGKVYTEEELELLIKE